VALFHSIDFHFVMDQPVKIIPINVALLLV